jgi:WD40 repeat protein
VHGGDFSADGKTVLTGGDDKTLRLWDASNGQALGKPLAAGTKIEKVLLSPDGKKEALLGAGGSFKLYPVSSDGAKALIRVDHKVQAAAFSPDSRWVVVAAEQEATLWDAASGKMAKTLSHGHALSNVLFSPDGSRIATVGTDGTVRLWDGQTGDPVGDPLKHEGPAQDSAFSPKGQALVLAYQDGGWQVWDPKTGEPIGDETQEGVLIEGLGFAADGTTLRLLDKKGNLKTLDSSWMGPMDPDQLLLRSRVAGLCAVDSSGSLDPVSTDSWMKDWRQIPTGANP